MRRGRWSPELPGTEWPAFHPQTDDCPPMSATVGGNTVNHTRGLNVMDALHFPTAYLYYFPRDLI